MRKWMSDRIKRRKKTSEEISKEPARTPLQPAYFDSGPPSPETPPEVQESAGKSAEPALLKPSEPWVESPAPGEHPSSTPLPMRQAREPGRDSGQGRRRRGRGGRGRARSGVPSTVSRAAGETLAPVPTVISDPGEPKANSASTTLPISEGTPLPRTPRGVVVLAIGLPCSGKSSWFKRHSITPLSSDLLRALLFDDPTEQRFQDLVFSNLRSMLKARLIARRPMNYVDATNLTSHDRRGWIKLAQDYGYEVQAVFFDVPLEVCLERNRRRERVVSEDVMRRMAAKQKPPTFEEGFSKITVVRVKQKTS
jgi:predicted kinase